MSTLTCTILGVFHGGRDPALSARMAILDRRDAVRNQVMLEMRGFVGDQATQPYHGSPNWPCIHAQSHYDYWNEHLARISIPAPSARI